MTTVTDKVALTYDVYETTDYDKFKYMEGNRDVHPPHVRELARKMEREGNLMPERPVEVNEHLFVIDGQNRIQAAKMNKMPVYYRIVPNTTISTTISFNTGNRNWGWLDFAQSWAARGNQHYKEFVSLQKEYGFIFSVMLLYATGSSRRSSASDKESETTKFREGGFTIRDLSLTRKLLAQYQELTQIAGISTRELAEAMHGIMRRPGYQHQHMLDQIAAYGDNLHHCYTVTDYLMELENIQQA